MPKKVVQDVIPSGKRTIRRISVERDSKADKNGDEPVFATDEVKSEVEDEGVQLPPEPPRLTGEKRARRWWAWGAGALGGIAVLLIVFSVAFNAARVEIVPKNEAVLVDGVFTAAKTAAVGEVPFETFTVTRRGTREVEATGERQVDRKASGKIVIFNNFDESDQRLIKNTRFETPEGLTYRIPDSVVVPGRYEDEDGEITPGSVEVDVFADSSGAEYNIGLTDFTIPGFEGDPRFFKFFARSKTPMTGGFSGLERTVSERDELAAREAIRAELEEALAAAAHEELPDGYVLYDDATFTQFSSQTNEKTEKNDTVRIVEEGILQGFIFSQADLAQLIAENTIAAYDNSEVRFDELDSLVFSLLDRDTIEPVSADNFDFSLSGNGRVVWAYGPDELKENLGGKHRREATAVLSAYPAIERANITLRPFWKRSFPEKDSRINIVEDLPEEE